MKTIETYLNGQGKKRWRFTAEHLQKNPPIVEQRPDRENMKLSEIENPFSMDADRKVMVSLGGEKRGTLAGASPAGIYGPFVVFWVLPDGADLAVAVRDAEIL